MREREREREGRGCPSVRPVGPSAGFGLDVGAPRCLVVSLCAEVFVASSSTPLFGPLLVVFFARLQEPP